MLLDAVRNNAEWCDCVLRARGAVPEFSTAIWQCPTQAPPFYPNLITLTPDGVEKQVSAISQLKKRGLGADWGVKDSFARLGLVPLGFRLLYDAQWFALTAPRPADDIDWYFVENETVLNEWEDAWGEEDEFFPRSLLDNLDIGFAFARDGADVVAGAIFNRHAGVCGVSNFFAPDDKASKYFASVMARAWVWSGGLPAVGYTSEAALSQLTFKGLERLGPLRIWLFGS